MGAGQTQRWTQFARSEDGTRDRHVRAGSTETATGTTTTMSWTSTTSYPWAIGAVPINPIVTKNDQTGLLVYTLDPSVKLAVAWGQDPQTATAGAPGLDVGTSVPPMPEFTAGKDGLLYDATTIPRTGTRATTTATATSVRATRSSGPSRCTTSAASRCPTSS